MTEQDYWSNDAENIKVAPTGVITGDNDYRRFLYYQLRMSMRQADSVDIIVSFLLESGVRMLLEDLAAALERGVRIRILTGNYLGITQPSALYLLKKEFGERIDLRFYNDNTRSFHPKAYIFHYGRAGEIFIGSSNISCSALTRGIEWNYRLVRSMDRESFDGFLAVFEDLFAVHSIIISDKVLADYSRNWHRPALARDLARYAPEEEDAKVSALFQPRGAQIEALYALEQTRREGAVRGLVQAATGIGKTYLAAFDSAAYKRVLFVAHREEILRQAAESFRNVRSTGSFGFFDGSHKDTRQEVIFANVASLGKAEFLQPQYFQPDAFDYLVVDEFHHAVNKQYTNIINYFRPQFLLGLTATPDRLDGRDIYELCDYNVPYEISLKTAINKGMLVPFRYYGIYDATDYSGLPLVRGQYAEQDLNVLYIGNARREELIYKHYRKYPSKRALGFCCSRRHAEAMARAFAKRGVRACAVYSNACSQYALPREEAVSALIKGDIQVIFAVDMFNEGVDIPNVDMVMFLRPTESPTIFLQQLGRGLRQAKGKEYLIVLDFIGNYARAGRAPYLLAGSSDWQQENQQEQSLAYPDDCLVDFDLQVLDLFESMARKGRRIRDIIREEFYRVRDLLGHVPARRELFTCMDDAVYQICMSHPRENIFKNFLEFKKAEQLLTEEEEGLYNSAGRELVHLLETTGMVRVYKMPVLMAFYNKGNIRMSVSRQELLASWKEFFGYGTNWKDLPRIASREEFLAVTDREHLSNILRNPVKYLQASGKGLFIETEDAPIALAPQLEAIVQQGAFAAQLQDIIQYRTMDYYQRRYREK